MMYELLVLGMSPTLGPLLPELGFRPPSNPMLDKQLERGWVGFLKTEVVYYMEKKKFTVFFLSK